MKLKQSLNICEIWCYVILLPTNGCSSGAGKCALLHTPVDKYASLAIRQWTIMSNTDTNDNTNDSTGFWGTLWQTNMLNLQLVIIRPYLVTSIVVGTPTFQKVMMIVRWPDSSNDISFTSTTCPVYYARTLLSAPFGFMLALKVWILRYLLN